MVVGGTAGGFRWSLEDPKNMDVCYYGGFHRVIMENCRGSMVTDASLYSVLQDDEDGGIADRPDDMADVFTRFGIAGFESVRKSA
jgi:prenyltransferase beta subunit